MSWLGFTTHEQLNQYMEDNPKHGLRTDEISDAHWQIDQINVRKHRKVDSGCITRFLKRKKNMRKFNQIISDWRLVMNYKDYTKHLKYGESAMAPW